MSNDFIRSLPGHERDLRASWFYRINVDPILFFLLSAVVIYGLIVLYSAVGQSDTLFQAQLVRLGLAFAVMIVAAQLPPQVYIRWSPVVYLLGLVLLVLVLLVGVTVKGSQRWLDIPGLVRFQPSELMKIAVPMAVAWYFHSRPLPPSFKDVCVALAIVAIPAGLIIMQPDLGTAVAMFMIVLTMFIWAGYGPGWIFLLVSPVVAAVSSTSFPVWLVFTGVLAVILYRRKVTVPGWILILGGNSLVAALTPMG